MGWPAALSTVKVRYWLRSALADIAMRPTGRVSVLFQVVSRPTSCKELAVTFGATSDGATGAPELWVPVGLYCTSRSPELTAACTIAIVLPATVSVQSRGVPVMFALAVMVICPLPVPFVGETVSQSAQGLNEFQLQFGPVATVTFTDAGWHDIVRRLAQINVVVGMHHRLVAALPAQQFNGAVGDNFVGVHVRRGAGTGLKDVDRKMFVPFTARTPLHGACSSSTPSRRQKMGPGRLST